MEKYISYKKCPFCGSTDIGVTIHDYGKRHQFVSVGCSHCGCRTKMSYLSKKVSYDKQKDELKALWNNRV